jgi:hypothetical protein
MANRVQDTIETPNSSYRNAALLTEDDDNDLANPTKEIYIGGAGSLHVTTVGGQEVTFPTLAAGTILHLQVKKLFVDSTATNVIGLW